MTDDIDSSLWRVGNDIGTDYEIQLRDYITSLQNNAVMYRNEIAEMKSCDGCIHKPLQGENYYEPCGDCRRFYGDFYESEDKE